MDGISSIAELIVALWEYVCTSLSFIKIRHEGFAVIKKRWGKPVKVYALTEHFCWKWPIAETFDEVDIRKQIIYLNAHSIKSPKGGYILPLNTTIDTQAEFKVVNPTIIYKISDDIVRYDENNYTTTESYVDNVVHLLISKMLEKNGKLSGIFDVQEKLNDELALYNKNKSVTFSGDFDAPIENCLIIEKIVVVSYDYNFSLRNTE